LDEVRKAGLRARDLVQQILAFSQQKVQDRRPLSLSKVAGEAARLLRPTLPAGIELAVHLAPNTPDVLGDASQIHQVILNLCTNSWHAIQNNTGQIELRLDRVEIGPSEANAELQAGIYARLRVRDTGSGMDPATLEHIFEPFFTTKTRGRGTGLGLAVVHGIVKNHDGVIQVSSRPGEGTTFDIFFPSAHLKAIPPATDLGVVSGPSGRGERILYLDDEASLVSLASRALEKIGYRVTGFTRPAEALAAFRQDPKQFEVVVTDFNMPEMSGLEFAQHVLKLRPEVPLLLTSGYLSDELNASAKAAGVTALIYKPNTISELQEAIHRWVSESSSPARVS
jgi:CheY-like chemotaxis protein